MAFEYLFDFITRKVNDINIILKYLLLRASDKKFDKEKALLKIFNRF